MKKDSTIYEPNKYLKEGFFHLWKNMFAELKASAGLGYRLFLRDFSAKYKQSLFGIFWVVLFPLFIVGVFVGMNNAGIFNIKNTGVPYPIFVLFGVTVWSLFTTIVSSVAGIIGQAAAFVTKINFPRISLIQSPVYTALVDFVVKIILLGIVMLIYKTTPSGLLFTLPLFLLPLILLSIGIGMFLSIIGAVFRDIPNFINMFLGVAMFLTPVVYPLPENGMLAQINRYNPLYYLIDSARGIFFEGQIAHPIGFSVSLLLSLIIFLAGWRFYYVAIARIVEKV